MMKNGKQKKTSRLFQKLPKGFLAIVSMFLTVVIGMLAVVTSFMFVGNATSQGNMAQSEDTFYNADSGLERTVRAILTPTLTGSTSNRIACAAVIGSSNLTGASATGGTFTATSVSNSPMYVNTSLSAAITATSTSIPIASTSGLGTVGTVMVDLEEISYGGVSGNNLIAVQRGYHGTYATAHAAGAGVAHYQCNLNVIAGTPNLTKPNTQRQLQETIALQEAWAVGNVSGGAFLFTRWNRPTEVAWNLSTTTAGTSVNLNKIFMLSNADGWAVGAMNGLAYTILHWKGASWAATSATASCGTQTLNDITAVSSTEAYAVGAGYLNGLLCLIGTNTYTILKWNGTSWAAMTAPTSTTLITLNSVHVIGTAGGSTGNLGFAVGTGGTILRYNGSTWTQMTSPTTQNLLSVYIVSATEAWAVGAAGTILKFNGTSWATFSSPTTAQLNSVKMLDASLAGTAQFGMAVGNAGMAVMYNGTSWTVNNTITANALNAVGIFAANDVWAAGVAGAMVHWDGTSWSSIASGTALALNGLSVIRRQPFPTGWQEIFA